MSEQEDDSFEPVNLEEIHSVTLINDETGETFDLDVNTAMPAKGDILLRWEADGTITVVEPVEEN